MLQNGLYEQVINKALEKDLSETDRLVKREPIDAEEAAKVLSKYIAEVTEQQLLQLKDKGGKLKDQIRLVNRVIRSFSQDEEEKDSPESVAESAEQLLAVLDRQNNI